MAPWRSSLPTGAPAKTARLHKRLFEHISDSQLLAIMPADWQLAKGSGHLAGYWRSCLPLPLVCLTNQRNTSATSHNVSSGKVLSGSLSAFLNIHFGLRCTNFEAGFAATFA